MATRSPGLPNAPLAERGHEQAALAARTLADKSIGAVCSGDALRTRHRGSNDPAVRRQPSRPRSGAQPCPTRMHSSSKGAAAPGTAPHGQTQSDAPPGIAYSNALEHRPGR
ncbi:histidine phosphatase family protein [Streptomyces sp. NPDC046942]|uniref:histidine phosphatase family protein n=1 Tax=Streptomyces sp. NPDC046942 TaxID=3155137 RepID=UPI0033E13F19